MLKALRRVVDAHPDVIAVFPIHHNPMVRKAANEILCGAERIRMIEPPEFVSFHHLLSKAYLVMTDSGGIQEEAASLGIPTLVMRYSSERAEGIRAGVLKLAGSGEEGIFTLADRLLAKDSDEYLSMRRPSSVYGDGHAASRIVDFLVKTI
jgi:UDP-N-acetylglucosamine 2-epimerase (non-hydrolysing)